MSTRGATGDRAEPLAGRLDRLSAVHLISVMGDGVTKERA